MATPGLTIPAGLGVTLGIGAEGSRSATPGWGNGIWSDVKNLMQIEANEGFELKKNILQTKVLHGSTSILGSQRVYPTREAIGKLSMNVTYNQMGLLLNGFLGKTHVSSAVDAVYTQSHQISTTTSPSFVFQKGVPQLGDVVNSIAVGTIQPFTYPGAKFTDWEFSVKRSEQLKVTASIDAIDEIKDTSVPALSFLNTRTFHFGQGSVFINPSTAVNPMIVAGSPVMTLPLTSGAPTYGGVFAGAVSSFMLKGVRKLDTKRFTMGSELKLQQIENDFMEISGEIEIEFASIDDYYQYFHQIVSGQGVETPVELAVRFIDTGRIIGTTGSAANPTIQFLLPQVFFDGESPKASTPGILMAKGTFQVLDNLTTNSNILQIDYITTDNDLFDSATAF